MERWRASAHDSSSTITFQAEYVWGQHTQHMLAARDLDTGGDVLFPLTDERNSIIGIWNETDTRLTEYIEYDPDGRMRIRTPEDDIACSDRNLEKDTCFLSSSTMSLRHETTR